MFKSMKLGTKIGVGFGLLLMIAMTLGGLAVWKMSAVRGESDKLAKEYAPEVTIVSELERDSADTMYEIRGYGFTEEKTYVDEGRKSMARIKDGLKKADELVAKSSNLTKFKEALPSIQSKVAEYENMINETEAKVAKLDEIRKVLDTNAKKFMENCNAFLQNQNEVLKDEIRSSSNTSVTSSASTQPTQTADATSLQKKLEERVAKINIVNDIIDLGNASRIANWRSQAERDPKVIQEGVKNIDVIVKKLDELRQITRLAEDLKRIDEVKQAGNNYGNAMNNLLAVWTEMQELAKKRGVVGDEVIKQSKAVAQAGIEQTNEIATSASAALGSASTIMLVGLSVAFIVGVMLAIFITRSITGPINRIITGLTEGADQVNDAAGQVSSASQQLASGAGEQASSLEETSSALEEMAAMTRTNAASAKEANGLASQARTAAQEGDQTMVKLNGAMTGINESSQKISKIIKVIEEIAFQTNLLALNAAVEAARAGEHGKGFAVVADEVRNLAQRCAQAAKETTGLIEDAVNRSREGTQVANDVGKALGAIVGDVSKVSGLIDAISKASDEQAQGVDQVNVAVSQMDKVTQQNAAAAEESASASEEMAAQAQAVKGMVNELMTMVSGHNNSVTVSASSTKAKTHSQVKQNLSHTAQADKNDKKHQAVAAKASKGNDFISADDDDMKEF